MEDETSFYTFQFGTMDDDDDDDDGDPGSKVPDECCASS